MATETHIIPDVDGEEHDFEGCLCQPSLRQTGDGPIYTHNSFRKTGRYQIFESIPDAPSPVSAATGETTTEEERG